MKIKYGHLHSAGEALNRLANVPMLGKHRIQIRAARQAVDQALQPLIEERNSLIEEYGDEDQSIGPQSEGWTEFSVAYEELINAEVEVDLPKIDEEIVEGMLLSTNEEDALQHCGIIS